MLLHIIARGKIGRGAEAELVDRYLKRIAWPVKLTELPESGGKPPQRAENSVTILLDEKGEQLASLDLAGRLERWRDGGRREARFLIGGRRRLRRCRARRRRPAPRLRQGDLAAFARPRRCSPNNCSARRASLPTIPIIAKDSGMRRTPSSSPSDPAGGRGRRPRRTRRRRRGARARQARSGRAATQRFEQLDREARRATSDADRARAEAGALAARIEAAEAELTAAERRIGMIGAMQAAQRARLAARQGPRPADRRAADDDPPSRRARLGPARLGP